MCSQVGLTILWHYALQGQTSLLQQRPAIDSSDFKSIFFLLISKNRIFSQKALAGKLWKLHWICDDTILY